MSNWTFGAFKPPGILNETHEPVLQLIRHCETLRFQNPNKLGKAVFLVPRWLCMPSPLSAHSEIGLSTTVLQVWRNLKGSKVPPQAPGRTHKVDPPQGSNKTAPHEYKSQKIGVLLFESSQWSGSSSATHGLCLCDKGAETMAWGRYFIYVHGFLK